jgi:hypothetical protein
MENATLPASRRKGGKEICLWRNIVVFVVTTLRAKDILIPKKGANHAIK